MHKVRIVFGVALVFVCASTSLGQYNERDVDAIGERLKLELRRASEDRREQRMLGWLIPCLGGLGGAVIGCGIAVHKNSQRLKRLEESVAGLKDKG